MNPADPDRVARLERQVAYLLQHLGIDPEVAASQPGGSALGSPADIFGAASSSPGQGSAPAAMAGSAAVTSGPPAPGTAPASYPTELLAAIQRGKMIDAIKIYRQLTGLGLHEAKSAVEAIARGQP